MSRRATGYRDQRRRSKLLSGIDRIDDLLLGMIEHDTGILDEAPADATQVSRLILRRAAH
jgi:hypothetical protein